MLLRGELAVLLLDGGGGGGAELAVLLLQAPLTVLLLLDTLVRDSPMCLRLDSLSNSCGESLGIHGQYHSLT